MLHVVLGPPTPIVLDPLKLGEPRVSAVYFLTANNYFSVVAHNQTKRRLGILGLAKNVATRP